MNLRSFAANVVLIIVMVAATVLLMQQISPNPLVAVYAGVLMFALGALILSLSLRTERIENQFMARERMVRGNLEDFETRMTQRYDRTMARIDEVITEFSKRAYR
jgi:hypothetical protein